MRKSEAYPQSNMAIHQIKIHKTYLTKGLSQKFSSHIFQSVIAKIIIINHIMFINRENNNTQNFFHPEAFL